jgi:hypothetical protein
MQKGTFKKALVYLTEKGPVHREILEIDRDELSRYLLWKGQFLFINLPIVTALKGDEFLITGTQGGMYDLSHRQSNKIFCGCKP